MSLLVRGAHLPGADRVDFRITRGLISEMAAWLPRQPGEEVVEAGGGEAIPGLHDHHVHLRAWAAAVASVPAGPPAVRDRAGLARALNAGAPGQWVRAVGYHESVAGLLDRWDLDRLCPDRPVRLQHRSGALWMLNSAALGCLNVDRTAPPGLERTLHGEPTGRVWREDRWMRDRLAGCRVGDLAAVGRLAAAAGVTGMTDATPSTGAADVEQLHAAVEAGQLPQRVTLMTPLDVAVPAGAAVAAGPVKFILDDDRLPGLARFASDIRAVHDRGRCAAVHCVTAAQAALTVAALTEAGSRPGDRLEHAAVLSLGLVRAVAGLGLTVVTQPGFVHERGDHYLRDVAADEHRDLWRLGSLIEHGIGVATGTDAPFGPPDPWLAIGAAIDRRTRNGAALGASDAVGLPVALGLWAGTAADPTRARSLQTGAVADLCVLDRPLGARWAGRPEVVSTVVGGRVIYRAG